MARRKLKKEWHVYSCFAITSALMIISASFFSGTSQVIGTAMGPIVGTTLGMSKEYKNLDVKIHKWLILISVSSIILARPVYRFFLQKDKNE